MRSKISLILALTSSIALAEAFLIATACSDAPKDPAKWTMQLLAERYRQCANSGLALRSNRQANAEKNKVKPWLKEQ